MTPEQLDRLRHQLPPLREAALPSPQLQTFCREYGVDFAQRLPGVEHIVGQVSSGDHTLAVHYWQQAGASANLLLVHGYFDHTGLFGKLVEWGLTHNCNVLVFDLPGHGLSSGEAAVIDDFADYSCAIADVLKASSLPQLPLWVMAQSTGAAALVDFAGKYPWPFAAVVLLAPLVRPAGWSGVRAAHALLGHFVESVPRKFSPNSSDPAFLDFLKADPLQCDRISLRWVGALRRWLGNLKHADLGVGPALVLQGESDKTVDWHYNVKVMGQLFPGSRVEYLPGAGHHLANETTQIRDDYLGSVESWLAEQGIELAGASGIEAR